MISICRVYDYSREEHEYSIFVDRLWPRGFPKSRVSWDLWMKDIAPSPELRKWFGHEPDRWEEFRKRYTLELLEKKSEIKNIREIEQSYKKVILLYAAKDKIYNHAHVIVEFLL